MHPFIEISLDDTECKTHVQTMLYCLQQPYQHILQKIKTETLQFANNTPETVSDKLVWLESNPHTPVIVSNFSEIFFSLN